MEEYGVYEIENGKDDKKSSFRSDLFEWLEILVSALILLVILFTFVFKLVTIDGESMENTLFDQERVIISNIGYEPKYGDIVVISRNQNNIVTSGGSGPIIKRIIATEGQTVDIDFTEGVVYVDGVALEEPYTKEPTYARSNITFPVTVPENCVFVLGDNRNNSTDSRSTLIGEDGMIDCRYILGKVVCRVLPVDKFGSVE